MNINLVVLVTSFVLSRCPTVSGNSCPISWHPYRPEDVCIKVMDSLLDFRTSRKFCQRFGGDLADIVNYEKEIFVKDKYSRHVTRVGIQDSDSDGTFEYLNGTKVSAFIQQRIQNSLDTEPRGACVTLDTYNSEMRKGPCETGQKFICEVKRSALVKHKAFGQPCSLNDCPCNKQEWIETRGNGGRLIKVNTHRARKRVADTMCQRMGGQLLQTGDPTTINMLKDIYAEYEPKDFELWLGLNEKKGTWFWDNGQRVMKKIAWGGGNGSCGGVHLTSHPEWTWRRWTCGASLSSICQATNPCPQPTVTMRVGGKKIIGRSEVFLTDENHSVVECLLGGDDRSVKDVVLTCGHWEEEGKVDMVKGKPYISLHSRVDENDPRKRCVCRVRFSEGAVMGDSVIANITFKSRPRMVNRNKNYQVFKPTKGKEFRIRFQIYANPEPEVGTLEKFGPGAFLKDYRVAVEPSGKPIHYRVSVLMRDFGGNQTGIYCLSIGNGLEGDGDLKYVFGLKLRPEPKSVHTTEQYGLLLIPVVAAFLLTCVVFTVAISMLASLNAHVVNEDVRVTEESVLDNESNKETDGGTDFEDDVYGKPMSDENDGRTDYLGGKPMSDVDDGRTDYLGVDPARDQL